MSSGAPSPLSRLLKELFQSNKWEQRLEQHALFLAWEEIVGPELAVQARPDCIRGEVLWLKVSDSVWMQQLQYQKISLLETINRYLGKATLRDIRFRLATEMVIPAVGPKYEGRKKEKTMSLQEQQQFEEIASPLGDDELKEVLRRLWLKNSRARKE